MKKKDLIKSRSAIVAKSNDLIQKSRFSLTAQQQKIVLYLISKITPEDTEFKRYKFSINEFYNIFQIIIPKLELIFFYICHLLNYLELINFL